MVGFMFGNVGGLEMVGSMVGSDSIVIDGPEMFGFVWESGCCAAGDAGDGLVMVGITWDSGWCTVGDGLVMIGFSGHMCWRLQW